jgi:transposase
MAEPTCPNCLVLQRRVAELEAHVERLTRLLEQQQRAGKRQAAPFAKGPPQPEPNKPGRQPGADYGTKAQRPPPRPEPIDEVHQAPLPEACPACGGPIDETPSDHQYQVEIPRKPIYRQCNVPIGQCRACRRRVPARHPLQTSDARGAAASPRGPDAQAAVVQLNKQAGLSHGQVSRCLDRLFGITLTPGGSTPTVLRAARRWEPGYATIGQSVAAADWVVPDETGWHVGGHNAWRHALVGPEATAYVIDPTRSGAVAERILGAAYDGTLIHDGWSVYDHFEQARPQQCLHHLLGRCHDLEEAATRGGVRFPRRGKELLLAGLDLRDRHAAGQVSDHGLAVARGRLANALAGAVFPPKSNEANERLAQPLWDHREDLFTFLHLPGLEATSWRAELAIRCGVILHKVGGGNRTWGGCSRPGGTDVGMADLRAAGSQRPGLPEWTAARPRDSAGLAAVTNVSWFPCRSRPQPPPPGVTMR